MKERQIISAEDLLGKLDMDYDWELAEQEAFQRTPHKLDAFGVLNYRDLKRDYIK